MTLKYANMFYCPRCEKFEINIDTKNQKVTWVNPRDGYGRMITHIICPSCGYDLSGYINNCNEEEKEYIKYVIQIYTDMRKREQD